MTDCPEGFAATYGRTTTSQLKCQPPGALPTDGHGEPQAEEAATNSSPSPMVGVCDPMDVAVASEEAPAAQGDGQPTMAGNAKHHA